MSILKWIICILLLMVLCEEGRGNAWALPVAEFDEMGIETAAVEEPESWVDHNQRYITGIVFVVLAGLAVLFLDWNKSLVQRVRRRTNELSDSRKHLVAHRSMLLNVINTVPARVFWKGVDGRYLGCNQAFAEDASLERPEEIVGQSDYELIWKEQASIFRQDDFAVMDAKEGRLNYEELQSRKDGDRVLLTSKVPLIDEDNNVIGLLGTYNDITQMKCTEEHLMHLNSVLRTMRDVNQLIAQEKDASRLLQRATDLLVQDREMVQVWSLLLNDAGEVTSYSEAAVEHRYRQLDDSVLSGHMPNCLREAMDTNGLVISPGRSEVCDGCEYHCHAETAVTISCVLRFNRRTYGVILGLAEEGVLQDEEEINLFREVCDDLSFALYSIDLEQQKAQSFIEMMKAKEQAESASKAKDEFLTVMSHEMRTPLNPIMGFANLMRETNVPEPERTYLDTIIESAQRQLDLVNSILDFAKLEAGTLKPQLAEFDVHHLCQKALQDIEYASHGLKIRFENQVIDLQPVPETLAVKSEPQMLRQVLDNLLNNACKYTSEGSVVLSVGMRPQASGPPIFHFRVEDTGIGIGEAESDRLFDPFTQADSSSTRQYEGVGLGLAVCRKLLDLLGGSVGVKSELGKGSMFWFELAMEPVLQQPVQTPAVRQPAPKRHFETPRHILIVEDNKANVMIVQRLVEKFGGTTRVAVNGLQGVERCREESFDAVLMDLCMPVMNGFDATREILNSDNQNKETPIIALTADLSSDVRERCLEVGMKEYLTKPIRIQQLFDALNTLS